MIWVSGAQSYSSDPLHAYVSIGTVSALGPPAATHSLLNAAESDIDANDTHEHPCLPQIPCKYARHPLFAVLLFATLAIPGLVYVMVTPAQIAVGASIPSVLTKPAVQSGRQANSASLPDIVTLDDSGGQSWEWVWPDRKHFMIYHKPHIVTVPGAASGHAGVSIAQPGGNCALCEAFCEDLPEGTATTYEHYLEGMELPYADQFFPDDPHDPRRFAHGTGGCECCKAAR